MDYEDMKVAELKSLCDGRGLGYADGARKADLVALLAEAGRGEPIEVAAEAIDDEIMASGPFAVDMTVVQSDIDALTAAIDNALTVYGDVQVDPGVIEGMDAASLGICEKQLAEALKQADEARLQLGRDYRKPLDAANERYKELTGPAYKLRDEFAERRQELRRGGLERTYLDFCAGNGMEELPRAVPFQRLLDLHPQWMRRDINAGKSAQKVEEAARSIIDDWGALASQRASMRFYEEAEAEFFKTLDLSAAMRLNQERTQAQERIEAVRAEREAVEQFRRQEPFQMPAFTEVEPGPAPAPEPPAEPAGARQRRHYHFEAWLDDMELASFREWKNACNVGEGWTFREVKEVA